MTVVLCRRKRYGQMQLVVATDLPSHALTVSLTSVHVCPLHHFIVVSGAYSRVSLG